MENENTPHQTVVIENRSKIKIDQVEDVESFDEEKVVVYTKLGTMLITGCDFRVSRLNVDEGQLVIEGEADRVEYTDTVKNQNDGGFLSKLFR